MTRRTAIAVFLLFAAAASLGCSPPWQIVKQTTPDPFVGKTQFALLPINFTGLRVGEKDEVSYLAEKDEESKQKWAGDKEGINGEFAQHLMATASEAGITVTPTLNPAGAEFILRPAVAWLEPGYYIGIASGASQVRMMLQILSPNGSVIDEILLEHGTAGSLTNAAVGTRLREDGEDLGRYAGKYLVFRNSGKAP
jgi:hypothetical protein